MNRKVLLNYSSPFCGQKRSDIEFQVINLQDSLTRTIPLKIECPGSDIYLLRQLFGPTNALMYKNNVGGSSRAFKLDGSDKIWKLERDFDVGERHDYQWAPKYACNFAVVSIMANPCRSTYHEIRRIDAIIIELIKSANPPTAVIQHGSRTHFVWKLTRKITREQNGDFENRFHSKFDTVPSDLSLFQITPGLRDVHMNKPHSVYLSDAVYGPSDMNKMYAEAAAPSVSELKAAAPARLKRIEKVYDLLPPTGMLSCVGHILAHKRELHVNVDPAFSMAWQRYPKDGGETGLYCSHTGSIADGEIAKRISGDGPEQVDIVNGVPRRETDADYIDVQINVVRDMHRALPKMTRKWLNRFVNTNAIDDLQRVAAVMLAVGLCREDGIDVLALYHGDLFAKDIQPGDLIPEDINDRIGIITTEAEMERRLKVAAEAFNAVPNVGKNVSATTRLPADIFDTIQVPRLEEGMVPPVLWRFMDGNAKQIGAAREALFVSCLFVCAAAISDDVKIKPRSNADWLESPRIWAMLIAPPSAKKSPAAGLALKPLQAIDRHRVGAAVDKGAKYDLAMRIFKAKEAAYIREMANGKDAGDPPVPPEAPRSERLLIMDATTEAVVNIAMNQNRGLALYRDELGGWFGSFDAYKGGGKGSKDAPFWLSAYNGDGWIVDRVSRVGGTASNVGTSIFGGIQHDALRGLKLLDKRDGMLARFFPVILDKRDGNVGKNIEADTHANNIYELLIAGLVELTPERLDGTSSGPVVCPDEISEQVDTFLRDVVCLGQLEGAVPDAMAEHLGNTNEP
jgi:hypothetical protein